MEAQSLLALAMALVGFGLISARLSGTILTAPILFVAAGLLLGPLGLHVVEIDFSGGAIETIAEFTLVLVLFTDAARIDVRTLWRYHNLPMRMLLVGLPLTILAGIAAAMMVFLGLPILEAALLAAILAPTDAALGQAVVSDRVIPVRIRQTLNAESGLNDGIALPVVLLFASLALATEGPQQHAADWIEFGLLQITLGPLAGILAGYIGGRLIDRAAAASWMTTAFQGLSALGVALAAFAAAELIGGNGFIAAFVAGLTVGNVHRGVCEYLFDFAESEGQLLTVVTFFLFGTVIVPQIADQITLAVVFYALLSLTVVRMVPMILSLLGTGLSLPTWFFLGWFGSRGLASILFALLVLDENEVMLASPVLATVSVTVLLSVLLHGVTAAPAARWYGRKAVEMGDCEEVMPVEEMPTRYREM
ncbi:MAG: cation:proton antiporter [Alphaproteobacteria bacterium]|nr:cation:proton antiporter [Alphaproteobacteria bacterium]